MEVLKEKKSRILIAKADQDAHELSVRYLSHLLREEGMEVIFVRYFLINEIAKAAIEEDVAVVALSFYGSGLIHDTFRLIELMRQYCLEGEVPKVIVGGTINKEEEEELIKMGVTKVFMPGIGTLHDVSQYIKNISKGSY
ncbi:MAG TPA: cobalamin-dependent protein [Syntrophales bacterium]|nr:cobalamin-dependent protein [Syntrophales bacterium]